MACCGNDSLRRRALLALAALALASAAVAPAQPASRPTSGPLSRPASRPASRPVPRPQRPHHRLAARLIKQLELPALRADAVKKLLHLGKDAAPDLGRALHDPRPEVVLCVAQMLRMLGPGAKAALPHMERLAKSPDKMLANAARHAMSAVRPAGITVLPLYGKSELREIDAKGKTLRTITGLSNIFDARRLPNGNYLICQLTA
ncbi:MAG: HEAT repeat domain-containing protein, partial [Planctomycetota bacterium]